MRGVRRWVGKGGVGAKESGRAGAKKIEVKRARGGWEEATEREGRGSGEA